MRVGELARRTGATVRALRYYEAAGLVVPDRLGNGYREYPPIAVRLVEQVRSLTALGLTVEETRPFVECLVDGNEPGDVCPAALAAYRRAITDLEGRIGRLTAHRDALSAQLDTAAERTLRPATGRPATGRTATGRRRPAATAPTDPAGLVGTPLPGLTFPATDGTSVDLGAPRPGRTLIFLYPLSGRPGVDLPEGWARIPGARGCTQEACGFRDQHARLRDAGARRVYGLSAQPTGYQRELAHRLRLPYPLLADPRLSLAAALGLPTFEAGGMTLYRRLTIIVTDGVVEHVFHPVSEPAAHAEQVLRWLAAHPE